MHVAWRFLLVSLLIWLIPFVASFPFFGREGKLVVNFWVFKAVMAVLLTGSTFYLFRWLYRSTTLQNRRWITYALVGLGTMTINIALDTFTVIPFTNMTTAQYVAQIVSLYLLIIVISTYTGIHRA